MLRGVVDLRWEQIAALSVFLPALGVLLRFGDLRAWGGGDVKDVDVVHGKAADGVVSRTS